MSARPTRVLFLAWGESIHARRRIAPFAADPAFAVAVAATFRYGFPGAREVLLTASEPGLDRHGWRARASYLGRKSAAVARDLWRVRRLYTAFQPDVVFLQQLLYPSYLATALPSTVPLMVTFWNGDLTWSAKWNPIERLAKPQIVNWGLRRAQAITVNSRAAVEACVERGVAREKVHLIRYPGADLDRFRPGDRNLAKQTLGWSSRRVVLCPRGLAPYFNADVVLEAARGLVKRHPDVLFVFLSGGTPPEWAAAHQSRARELKLEPWVTWPGKVPWEQMPTYHAAADVMVSISSLDSLPNAMLEAMACGVPVIMGDIPTIRDWMQDGVHGRLVPPRDPDQLAARIADAIERPATWETMTRAALELVQREADGRSTIPEVKALVNRVAGRA